MMLQRIRSLANWIASDFVSEMSAPLAAVYASWARVNPASAETEPIRITEPPPARRRWLGRSEEHTSELQSRPHLVCRLLLEKKKKKDPGRTKDSRRTKDSAPTKPRGRTES